MTRYRWLALALTLSARSVAADPPADYDCGAGVERDTVAGACRCPPHQRATRNANDTAICVDKEPRVVKPRDRDRDGIADKADRCPGDAEDLDGVDDADGCPEVDDDQDGVADAVDACPYVAEDRDGFQDDDGCAEDDPAEPVVREARELIGKGAYVRAVKILSQARRAAPAAAEPALYLAFALAALKRCDEAEVELRDYLSMTAPADREAMAKDVRVQCRSRVDGPTDSRPGAVGVTANPDSPADLRGAVIESHTPAPIGDVSAIRAAARRTRWLALEFGLQPPVGEPLGLVDISVGFGAIDRRGVRRMGAGLDFTISSIELEFRYRQRVTPPAAVALDLRFDGGIGYYGASGYGIVSISPGLVVALGIPTGLTVGVQVPFGFTWDMDDAQGFSGLRLAAGGAFDW